MQDRGGAGNDMGKVYAGSVARLRSERRLKLIDPDRVLAAALERGGFESALDIGTGSALFAELFAKKGLFSVGVDLNPEMVRSSRAIAPQALFMRARAEHLPFRDRSFSLAFLGHLLHESDDPVRVLRECRRVAAMRTVVLEWPCRAEEAGPPPDHRLQPGRIREYAREAGFLRISPVPHPDMTLILLGA